MSLFAHDSVIPFLTQHVLFSCILMARYLAMTHLHMSCRPVVACTRQDSYSCILMARYLAMTHLHKSCRHVVVCTRQDSYSCILMARYLAMTHLHMSCRPVVACTRQDSYSCILMARYLAMTHLHMSCRPVVACTRQDSYSCILMARYLAMTHLHMSCHPVVVCTRQDSYSCILMARYLAMTHLHMSCHPVVVCTRQDSYSCIHPPGSGSCESMRAFPSYTRSHLVNTTVRSEIRMCIQTQSLHYSRFLSTQLSFGHLRWMYRVIELVKNRLFSRYCSNLYLCSLWAKYRKSSIRNFIVSYNNAYRILHNLPMRCSAGFMFANAVVDNCTTRVRKCIF